MISSREYIQSSLELNLFFARLMQENALFLQLAFLAKDKEYIRQAEEFRKEFSNLLWETTILSKGVISQDVLDSKELVTEYTVDAENVSSRVTGIKISVKATNQELKLTIEEELDSSRVSTLERRVYALNIQYMRLAHRMIYFYNLIITNVAACKLYVSIYPLLLQHMLREVQEYSGLLQDMQSRKGLAGVEREMSTDFFWNQMLKEHAQFLCGMLDPSQIQLIDDANNLLHEYDLINEKANLLLDMPQCLTEYMEESLNSSKLLQELSKITTEGLIDCSVKAAMLPLFSDHMLREVNYYIRALCQSMESYLV